MLCFEVNGRSGENLVYEAESSSITQMVIRREGAKLFGCQARR